MRHAVREQDEKGTSMRQERHEKEGICIGERGCELRLITHVNYRISLVAYFFFFYTHTHTHA